MSGPRLRTLVALIVVLAIGSAGILHAPQALARAGLMTVAQSTHAGCHGVETEKAPPVQAHRTLDCCLLLCSSLPAVVVPSTTQSFIFVMAEYPGYPNRPLVLRTVPPDPGPPRI
jgi:hypothetical protein